ncbi:hypothetical protein E8E11_006312 [Didymella keratinophila]|nr:hypothetical protein E8E11_006312 [Didymella keratinophila]
MASTDDDNYQSHEDYDAAALEYEITERQEGKQETYEHYSWWDGGRHQIELPKKGDKYGAELVCCDSKGTKVLSINHGKSSLQYKKAQIDEQIKHWISPHPCSIGRWDVTHYKEGALYVAQLALYTERSDGTLIENCRIKRKAASEEGVIAALETLLVVAKAEEVKTQIVEYMQKQIAEQVGAGVNHPYASSKFDIVHSMDYSTHIATLNFYPKLRTRWFR